MNAELIKGIEKKTGVTDIVGLLAELLTQHRGFLSLKPSPVAALGNCSVIAT